MLEHSRNLDEFEYLLGSIINSGYITFLYFPDIRILFESISIFNYPKYNIVQTLLTLKKRYNSNNPIEDIIVNSVSSIGLNSIIIEQLPSKCIYYYNLVPSGSVYRIEIKEFTYTPLPNKQSDVSLYLLLKMGIIPKMKKDIMLLYFQFDFDLIFSNIKYFSPWNIYYSHNTTDSYLLFNDSNSIYKTNINGNKEFAFNVIEKELSPKDTNFGEFSFIDYSSGEGDFSIKLAEKYPKATVYL